MNTIALIAVLLLIWSVLIVWLGFIAGVQFGKACSQIHGATVDLTGVRQRAPRAGRTQP